MSIVSLFIEMYLCDRDIELYHDHVRRVFACGSRRLPQFAPYAR